MIGSCQDDKDEAQDSLNPTEEINLTDDAELLIDLSEEEDNPLEEVEAEVLERLVSEDKVASRRVAQVLDATQLYLTEIGFSPLLSAAEEIHYGQLVRNGEVAARQK